MTLSLQLIVLCIALRTTVSPLIQTNLLRNDRIVIVDQGSRYPCLPRNRQDSHSGRTSAGFSMLYAKQRKAQFFLAGLVLKGT